MLKTSPVLIVIASNRNYIILIGHINTRQYSRQEQIISEKLKHVCVLH